MYYALSENLQLLCWEKQATGAILNNKTESLQAIKYTDFRLLVLADGQTDFSDKDTPDLLVHLNQLVDSGILVKSVYPIRVRDDWFRIYNNRCAITALWSITGRCNYQCKHCLMDAPNGRLGEATTDEMLSLVDEMANAGIRYIDITGGEPLLRNDFLLLIDKITSRGIKIKSIATNGSLLNQSIFDCLKRNKQQPGIYMSFDGTEGWHNWMRGEKNAEQAFLFAVELCRQNAVPVTATLCLHKGNQKVLNATVRMLKQCGVENLQIGNITHSPRWNMYSDGCQMTNQDYLDACLTFIDEYYDEGCPINLSLGGVASFEEKSGHYELHFDESKISETISDYVCFDLRNCCYITPDLRLLPCIGMTESDVVYQYPTIKECGGFQKALEHPLYLQTTTTTICDFLKHNKECDECDYRMECHGGCRACAMAENKGDFWAKANWNCIVWKNDYPRKINEKVHAAYERYRESVCSGADFI